MDLGESVMINGEQLGPLAQSADSCFTLPSERKTEIKSLGTALVNTV